MLLDWRTDAYTVEILSEDFFNKDRNSSICFQFLKIHRFISGKKLVLSSAYYAQILTTKGFITYELNRTCIGIEEKNIYRKGGIMQYNTNHFLTPLMYAAIHGDTTELKRHLNQLRQIDAEGKTALMYAAEYGNNECISLLIDEAGMQTKDRGYTALIISVIAQHTPPFPLIQAEATIHDSIGITVSNYAIARGNYSAAAAIEGYIKKNPKLTPLMCAARAADIHSVEKLMDQYICCTDTWGRTALMHAILCNKSIGNSCAHILLDREAGMVDVYGRTALIYATMNCNVGGIRLLLKAAQEIGTVDKEGKCALSYAIENQNYECMYLLADAECRTTPQLFAIVQNMKKDVMFKVFIEGKDVQAAGESRIRRINANPKMCISCKNKIAVIAAVPCKHVCICVDCCQHYHNSNSNMCPVCSQESCGWDLVS